MTWKKLINIIQIQNNRNACWKGLPDSFCLISHLKEDHFQQWNRSAMALSSWGLKASKFGDRTTSLGSMFRSQNAGIKEPKPCICQAHFMIFNTNTWHEYLQEESFLVQIIDPKANFLCYHCLGTFLRPKETVIRRLKSTNTRLKLPKTMLHMKTTVKN